MKNNVLVFNMASIKLYQPFCNPLKISYSFFETIFGKIIISSINKYICGLFFADTDKNGLDLLKEIFGDTTYVHELKPIHTNVINILQNKKLKQSTIKLCVKGTDFQLKVWRALLQIPFGKLVNYQFIATLL